jgi:hypothetical protein
MQYAECVAEVLKCATPADWIGLGGWCIIGRWKSWMPEFWATCWRCLPAIAAAGIGNVHIFGVLYQPALGGLLWLCDQHRVSLSTDSAAPVLAATWKGDGRAKKAGVRAASGTWRDNVAWWQDALGSLRSSQYYRRPPNPAAGRQLEMSDLWET